MDGWSSGGVGVSGSKKYCVTCGLTGVPVSIARGNFIGEVAVWLASLFILVFSVPIGGVLVLGCLFYSIWRQFSKYQACRHCESRELVPMHSPRAQEALREAPPPDVPPATQTPMVEHFITAQQGRLTYRVLARHQMTQEELRQRVFAELEAGRLAEPPHGETATLVLND